MMGGVFFFFLNLTETGMEKVTICYTIRTMGATCGRFEPLYAANFRAPAGRCHTPQLLPPSQQQ